MRAKLGIIAVVACNVLLAVAVIGAQEEKPHWTYDDAGEAGPPAWGQLSADYALCGDGKTQSPIDVGSTVLADIADIAFSYETSALNIFNNGHTVEVEYDEGSFITYGGKDYALKQFHFHHPSEHTLNGEAFPMEIHFVHKDADGNLAVVGVLLKEGAENAAYAEVMANLPAEESEVTTLDFTVAAEAMLPSERSFYTYTGSLTTPPCSEGVRWLLMTTPVELSAEQLASFSAIFADNSRPTQAINARDVLQDVPSSP